MLVELEHPRTKYFASGLPKLVISRPCHHTRCEDEEFSLILQAIRFSLSSHHVAAALFLSSIGATRGGIKEACLNLRGTCSAIE